MSPDDFGGVGLGFGSDAGFGLGWPPFAMSRLQDGVGCE